MPRILWVRGQIKWFHGRRLKNLNKVLVCSPSTLNECCCKTLAFITFREQLHTAAQSNLDKGQCDALRSNKITSADFAPTANTQSTVQLRLLKSSRTFVQRRLFSSPVRLIDVHVHPFSHQHVLGRHRSFLCYPHTLWPQTSSAHQVCAEVCYTSF